MRRVINIQVNDTIQYKQNPSLPIKHKKRTTSQKSETDFWDVVQNIKRGYVSE